MAGLKKEQLLEGEIFRLENQIAKLKGERLSFGLGVVFIGALALVLEALTSIPGFWLIAGYVAAVMGLWRLTGGD